MSRQKEKQQVKQELEELYDKKAKSRETWLQSGKIVRKDFVKVLKEKPKLNLILKLTVLANVGIWLTLILQFFEII